ncbi:lysine N(6)-hydroxylase/L-ornithine N(5)-oxygenase family protein [Actinomycetospora corticicola]|uniref:L-lysine N6-monooxygenase MbtG n=1 Tax=Actinomycetospora corticicola TaxID=663602 RepID=A0A7Y9DWC1_9PSEU|nr:SidA/IucD/PvdA family monooxygenase [Actinomycetospora corticicola]NYD36710.1 L-ornithine N5-oxygenase [Actinomycetospora corticicola]
MSAVPQHPAGREAVLDVVGVGFGPSNLALAIALAEYGDTHPGPPLSGHFLERQERFGWHRGMLLEDATMQVSYLKDLATLRNPRSGFSFVSYLYDRGRLVDFINYGSSYPTREEFHDYLEWAADRVPADVVDYGTEVTALRLVPGPDGPEDLVEVDVEGPQGKRTLTARNVVLGTGLVPHVPEGTPLGDRVWHSKDLLHRLPEIDREPRRLAVVGAGQSAAEVVGHLHRRFPGAEVSAIFARYGFSPADDSSFANRIFDPDAVDDFYDAPAEVKERILGYHGNTNYSVVDGELITALYRQHYKERVAGRERLKFHNASEVAEVRPRGDRTDVVVESLIDGRRTTVEADLVVYCTGYRCADPLAMLGAAADGWPRDDLGRALFHRDYSVVTPPSVTAGFFAPGATEHTHGLTSSLLSNVAVRAGEMVAAMVAARDAGHRVPVTRPAVAAVGR